MNIRREFISDGTWFALYDQQPIAVTEEIYDETTGEKLSDILSSLALSTGGTIRWE